MKESWQHAVEQILLVAGDSKARVISVLSPDRGAGVSTLCGMIAETSARSGASTMLVDLTQPIGSGKSGDWAPGDDVSSFIKATPRGYDSLPSYPSRVTRPQFNNIEKLRKTFAEGLASYDLIVVDLSAVLDQRDTIINPVAAARASDAVIMVCVTGETTQERVRKTLSLMDAAGVQIGGTVLNDRSSPPLGVDMATSLRGLQRFFRGASRLAEIAETNDFLNSRS